MSVTHWSGSGPVFTLSWCGRPWTLALDQSNPGLLGETAGARIELLALEGLAKAGRFEPNTFNGATILEYERYRDSIRATFAPPCWGGLLVRASWAHAPDRDQVDLEVQLSAASVGELSGVEVVVQSSFSDGAGSPGTGSLRTLEDLPGALTARGEPENDRQLPPRIWNPPGMDAGVLYLEMAHPNDVVRRTILEAGPDDSAPAAGTAR